ncbi:MAG: hypothetical protein KAW12_24275, partial [Candidatus Aminicenantes bacterium]|nr:hypothetical protein [Candidatus Aminicenantes bacterium]
MPSINKVGLALPDSVKPEAVGFFLGFNHYKFHDYIFYKNIFQMSRKNLKKILFFYVGQKKT